MLLGFGLTVPAGLVKVFAGIFLDNSSNHSFTKKSTSFVFFSALPKNTLPTHFPTSTNPAGHFVNVDRVHHIISPIPSNLE
jgi:hypothetical protein